MPLTPETWLNEFTVNLTTAGVQSDARVTHLANGNILVVWARDIHRTAFLAPRLGVSVI